MRVGRASLAGSAFVAVLLGAAGCETTEANTRPDPGAARDAADDDDSDSDLSLEEGAARITSVDAERPRDPSPEAYRALLTAEMRQLEGDAPGAIDAVREAIVHDPRSVFLRVRLGQLNLSVGDLERALKAARRALELDPNDIEALRLFAGAANLSGEREQARETLEHALRVAPGDRPSSTLLAELLIEDDEIERAEQVIDALMEAEPGATDGYLVLARLFKDRGETDRALATIEHALERDGRSPEALEMKIDVLYATGDYAAAAPTVQALIRERGDSRNTRYRLLVGLLLGGQQQEADDLVAAFLEEDDSADMLLLITDAQETAGETEQALALLKSKLADRPPRDDRVAVRYTRLLMAARAPDDAAAAICPQQPSPSEEGWYSYVRVLCARALMQAKRFDEAKLTLETTLERLPRHWRPLSALSTLAKKSPSTMSADDALQRIADALKERPLDTDLIDVQVRALEDHDRQREARAAMADALKRRPRHPELLMVQARHLERVGNPMGAVALTERLMDRSPRPETDHLNFAAFTLAEQGERLDDALSWAWRAVLREPLNGYIIDTLGWAQLQGACHGKRRCTASQLNEAIATLRRANRLSPDEPEVLFHLAAALAKADRLDEARALADRALTLVDEQDDLKADIETLVTSLKART
jgi:tetratricopeptide (TPR) repeat protein